MRSVGCETGGESVCKKRKHMKHEQKSDRQTYTYNHVNTNQQSVGRRERRPSLCDSVKTVSCCHTRVAHVCASHLQCWVWVAIRRVRFDVRGFLICGPHVRCWRCDGSDGRALDVG
jgi:hypothetical protein